jgi:hypothetical protein
MRNKCAKIDINLKHNFININVNRARQGSPLSVAERGPIGRTFLGRVNGLAVLGVNLLSNMVKEHCE